MEKGNLSVMTCACLACKAPSVSVMIIKGFGVGVLDDLTSMESGISGRPGHQPSRVCSFKKKKTLTYRSSCLYLDLDEQYQSERIED